FAARTAGEVDPREALEKIGPTKGGIRPDLLLIASTHAGRRSVTASAGGRLPLRLTPSRAARPHGGVPSHHVVTTSFGLTPLHPARPLACNERLRRDERDGVRWRASAFGYESEGRVFESPRAHSAFRRVAASGGRALQLGDTPGTHGDGRASYRRSRAHVKRHVIAAQLALPPS